MLICNGDKLQEVIADLNRESVHSNYEGEKDNVQWPSERTRVRRGAQPLEGNSLTNKDGLVCIWLAFPTYAPFAGH